MAKFVNPPRKVTYAHVLQIRLEVNAIAGFNVEVKNRNEHLLYMRNRQLLYLVLMNGFLFFFGKNVEIFRPFEMKK